MSVVGLGVTGLGIAEAAIAQLDIGNVELGDNNALIDEEVADSFYVSYEVESRYEKDKHIYMMGVTSPDGFQGASTAFVQLAAPTLLWIVDWTASCYFTQPDIPDPTVRDTNWILLDEHYEPAMIVLAADGEVPQYRISGTYIYGHKNPNTTTVQDLSFPIAPWISTGAVDQKVPFTTLTTGISNDESGGGSSSSSSTSSSTTSTTSPGREVQQALDNAIQ